MQKENPALIYGLIGYPVKHSLSPVMQKAAFAYHKISADYRLFEVENANQLEKFLLSDGEIIDTEGKKFLLKDLSGFNVTIPYKVKTKEILEKNFPFPKERRVLIDTYYVKVSGAVNTVKVEGILTYYNTDARGFLRSLKEDLGVDVESGTLKDKEVFVISCGGAGSAVIAALSWQNFQVKKIYIYDISPGAVESARKHFFTDSPWATFLKERLKFTSQEEIPEILQRCTLLVNASSLGMKDNDRSAVNQDTLHKDLYVYDVIYNRRTKLLEDAASRGVRGACGGKGMLKFQGAAAFEIWTGKEAPVKEMGKELEEALEKC